MLELIALSVKNFIDLDFDRHLEFLLLVKSTILLVYKDYYYSLSLSDSGSGFCIGTFTLRKEF